MDDLNRQVTERDVLEAFTAMADLGLVSPHRDVPEAAVRRAARTWAVLLGDITAAELQRAVIAYARSGNRWWPAAGELLKFVPRLQGPAPGEADAAWGEMLGLIRRHGFYDPPRASECSWPAEDMATFRRIEAGVEALGGWSVCCQIDLSNCAAERASFRSALTGHAVREQRKALTGSSPALRLLPSYGEGRS